MLSMSLMASGDRLYSGELSDMFLDHLGIKLLTIE